MVDLSRALWENYWHLAAHASELENAKDFVRFNIGNDELVIFNDGKDIIAFDNRCPHRGARIYDGVFGSAPFLCRYHGWSYAKGKVFIADKSQFMHCDLNNARLATFSIERLGDFFFVAVSPRTPLIDQLGDLYETVELISKSIAHRHDFDSYTYDCFWPIAVENALESYHVPMIHPTSLHQLDLVQGRIVQHGTNSAWYADVGNARTARRLEKLADKFNLDFFHRGYMNLHLFPYSMISSTFGLSYSIQNFFPADSEKQSHFYSRLFTSKLKPDVKPAAFDAFFDSTASLNRQVFREDNEICKRVPRQSWSPEPLKLYAESEQRILFFRQACKEQLILEN